MSDKKDKHKSAVETLGFKRPDASKLLFEIIDLNNPERDIPDTYHRHDFFEVVVIFEGATEHLVDFKAYTVKKNEILVIPQNSIHHGGFKEKLIGYIILFTKDFFTAEQFKYVAALEIFNASYGDYLLRFNEKEWDEMYPLLTAVVREYAAQKETLDSYTLRFLLLAFNTKLNTLLNNSGKRLLSNGVTRTFFELLENNYVKEHSVVFYCDKLNITPKKLAQTLLHATGKTTMALIIERLILEAKRELLFSQKTIKEIAFYLGFEDQLYFSKYFKKYTGLPPQSIRKEAAKISI